jgi:hypothetical protein
MMLLSLMLSLVVVVLAVVTWRLASAERRRSDARIEALAAAIDEPAADATAVRTQQLFEFDGGNDMSELSAFAPERVPIHRFPALAVAGGLILMLGTAAWLTLGGGESTRKTTAVPAAEPGEIELLSMRHSVDGQSLVVSGLVRNRSGLATPALTAVVTALDRSGGIVARGTSRLDPAVLQPGRETSFRVVVADVNDVGRYRVGFASGDRLVPHVDRRSDTRAASLAASRRD